MSGIIGSAKSKSGIVGGFINEADSWRITSGVSTTGGYLTTWERDERGITDTGRTLGMGMDNNSGEFTFPSTGMWHISFNSWVTKNGDTDFCDLSVRYTKDDTTYAELSRQRTSVDKNSFANPRGNLNCSALFYVVDVAMYKVKFWVESLSAITYTGNNNYNATYVHFIKLSE